MTAFIINIIKSKYNLLKTEGLENVDKTKKYVVASNHITGFDPFSVAACLNLTIAYMAKVQLFETFWSMLLMDWCGAFAVDRDKVDVSTIKTRPKGRKRIKTVVKTNKEIKDVLEMMYEELKESHQIYVIAPLIEESENSDLTNVNDLKEKMTLAFGSKYKIDLVHGKMASAAKELIMNEFLQNKVQILISTTVIEVGVDVPNATMMVIFNAERFGLSTLHQLRGRVGRSELQSSCILISDNDTKRLEIMESTNDGFEISEEDFKLRGHGDLFGTKQSGDMTFKIADLKADYKILLQAREDSLEYLLDKENDANKLRLIGTIIHS